VHRGYNARVQKANPPSITRYGANPHGRDFIVGDVHGCFDKLNQALKQRDFSPHRDRLFAVGDLIDRGPGSHKVLSWLKQPWFHSCLGNHEEMLLTMKDDSAAALNWLYSYGGEWWLSQDEAGRAALRDAFAKLPYVIELETVHGRVGIIHADIPKGMAWTDFIKLIEAGDPETRKAALWGRSRIRRRFSKPVAEIDRVVCGHTITPNRGIYTRANVWFIESGAFLDDDAARLTLVSTDELFA
jgi:serine/threonine protein phosphatase 1